jgi:hypothetical protein
MGRTPRLMLATLVATLTLATGAQAKGVLEYQDLPAGRFLIYFAEDAGSNALLSTREINDAEHNGTFLTIAASDVTTYQNGTGQCFEDFGFINCGFPAGGVILYGGAGSDNFFVFDDVPDGLLVLQTGNGGNDTLKDTGRNAPSYISGDAGNDTIDSGPGNDEIEGGTGNDIMDAGDGADSLLGGDGDDKLNGDGYADSASPDVIDGGPGFDSVDEWTDPSAAVSPAISLTLDGVANDGRPGENDNLLAVENITSHANGTFILSDAAEKIVVWANTAIGPSTIVGKGGNDDLGGLDEEETIDGGAGNDRITGGFGNDTLTGGPGADTIFGDDTGSYCGIYSCQLPFGNDTINVRDGEADNVDCGVGTDKVVADSIDTIAPNCEQVDRSAAPPPVPGPGAAPVATLAVKSTAKLGSVLKKGLPLSVTCQAACNITARLSLKGRKLGRARKALLAAGTAKLRIKLSKAAKRRLRRAHKPRLKLRVSVTNAAGATTVLTKTIRIKR